MQYVGRFVSTVYNTITPNINPATLSGAIDVIVVERQVETEVEEESEWGDEKVKKKVMTTELASTPFHVRFGKMSVLRPAERKVTLHLNNSSEPLPFAMKVGEEGEAFFVLELGEDEVNAGIPDDLVTSPILSAASSPLIAPDGTPFADSNSSVAGTRADSLPAENHRAPRKFIEEAYVEPLDLGASRAATSQYLNSDLESNETSTTRSGETTHTTNTADTEATTEKKEGESGEGKASIQEEGKIEDSEVAAKTSARKEDLQYMLDMDGYKMTADGEDLALAEGHRFADELPLSKRHGGDGKQGHSEVLSRPHQHTINQMSLSQKSGNSPMLHRRGSLGDMYAQATGERHGLKRRGSDSALSSKADFVPLEGTSFLDFVSQGEASGSTPAQQDSLTIDVDSGRLGQRNSVWKRWWNRTKEGAEESPERAGKGGSDSTAADDQSLPRPLDRSNTDSQLHARLKPEQKRASSAATVPVVDAKKKADKGRGNNKTYAKTLRLTSDQLKTLNLRKGANNITFSVTSSYSGVATCSARIFLWDASHQIVVSDIDGTITKSDALGHVFTMLGRDWTHVGVAKLYTDIARNGYRIMYLTSRAIGQADTTRDYLKGIRQTDFSLPDGPVIMSPDRLMASLHREVILRKPEVFKMACLRDIARLFGADARHAVPQPGGLTPANANESDGEKRDKSSSNNTTNSKLVDGMADAIPIPADGAATAGKSSEQNPTPFYAGFGNRITDALSYRSVNIPSSRIFTIDSNGEVKMELLELAGYKSSYIHMTDLVDQMFPPITLKSTQGNEGKPEYNDFNYWRPEIGQFDLPSDDELLPSPGNSSPNSPALSARSVKSKASVRSLTSNHSRQDSVGSINEADTGSSRLSRFGLGKLGISRKGSAQTIALPPPVSLDESKSPAHSSSVFAVSNTHSSSYSSNNNNDNNSSSTNRSTNDLPNLNNNNKDYAQTPSSPSSYGSGVTSWAATWRRRAASPGANGNAANVQATSPLVGPVITAEPEEEDSEGGGGGEDDDVSSFGDDDPLSEAGGQEEGTEGGGGASNMGDEVLEDDDPLLATGEIQFEWRG